MYNSQRLSKTLSNICKKYDFVIDRSLAVRSLIDYQYSMTYQFNQLYFAVFVGGFLIPNVYEMNTHEKGWKTGVAMFICLCTQVLKITLEVMKMGATRSLAKVFNIDVVSPLLFFLYQYIRIQ